MNQHRTIRSVAAGQVPVKIDTSRFYRAEFTKKMEVTTFWTHEKLVQLAERTVHKCLRHYEQQENTGSSFGSLYTGALGPCVYLRYKFSKVVGSQEESERLIREAFVTVRKALQFEQAKDIATQRVSLLEGSLIGTWAMYMVLLSEQNIKEEALSEASKLLRFMETLTQNMLGPSDCDVLYGRSGTIQAIVFLRSELNLRDFGSALAMKLAREILEEGLRQASLSGLPIPLLWEWHGTRYLGAAHGVVGILHTLLSMSTHELNELEKERNARSLIKETITALDQYCWSTGNLDSSIKDAHQTDRLVQWCHGAPGHVLLLARAADIFSEGLFRRRAQDICEKVVWSRGLLKKGVGLCHGISGNTYSFLAVARFDSSFQEKALHFIDFACRMLSELELVPDHPYSLYEGLAGFSCLLLDMATGGSHFPLYDHPYIL